MDIDSFVKDPASSLRDVKNGSGEIAFSRKFIHALILSFTALALLTALFIIISESADNPHMTEDVMNELLYTLDGISWKCSRKYRDNIEILFGIETSGGMKTVREGKDIEMIFDSGQTFMVHIGNGSFIIEAGRYSYDLHYSEKGVLYIISGDREIVWERI